MVAPILFRLTVSGATGEMSGLQIHPASSSEHHQNHHHRTHLRKIVVETGTFDCSHQIELFLQSSPLFDIGTQ